MMEAFYIIAAIAGIWGAFLKTLEHFKLTLPSFGKLLVRQPWGKILKRVYIGIAVVISLILFFSVVSIIYNRPFINNIWLSTFIFLDLSILGIWGVWVPVLQYSKNKRVSKTINIIGACLLALLFVGYWIHQWPEWHTPAIITSLIVLLIIMIYIFALIEKRREKVKA